MNRKTYRRLVLTVAEWGCYLGGAFLAYTALFDAFNRMGGVTRSLLVADGPRLLAGCLFLVLGMAFGMIVEMSREMELIA